MVNLKGKGMMMKGMAGINALAGLNHQSFTDNISFATTLQMVIRKLHRMIR